MEHAGVGARAREVVEGQPPVDVGGPGQCCESIGRTAGESTAPQCAPRHPGPGLGGVVECRDRAGGLVTMAPSACRT